MMEILEDNFDPLEPPLDAWSSGCGRTDSPGTAIGRGTALFRNGDSCDRFFLVSEGVVRVQAVSRTGREIVLYRVRPGEICMMTTLCLLDGTAYKADGIAETDARVKLTGRAAFERRLAGEPDFRSFVLGSLAQRMHDVVRLLQDVAFEGINGRLAQLLLERRDGGSTVCDTHEALALELGSAREVVSRRLKTFERNGWVRLARGRLDVVDADALKRVCAWGP